MVGVSCQNPLLLAGGNIFLLVNNGENSPLPGAIPGGVGRYEGGLMTGFTTSSHSVIPCARVLSVAGFSAFPPWFPLGLGFILGSYYLPYYRGFCHSGTLITVTIRTSRDSSFHHFMRNRSQEPGGHNPENNPSRE